MQVKYHSNTLAQPVDGIEPGTAVTVTASDPIHMTLTFSTVDSLLRALAWWRDAASDTADHSMLYRHAAAADAAMVLTEVHNQTGEPLQMWMDLGNSTTVADLAAGTQRLMQPLVRPVPRPLGSALTTHPPAMIFCIMLTDLQLQVRLRLLSPFRSLNALEHCECLCAVLIHDCIPAVTSLQLCTLAAIRTPDSTSALSHHVRSVLQLQGLQSPATKELFLTVHLAASSSGRNPIDAVRDGAQATTCTRCLRFAAQDATAGVNETFLLEVPDAVARALAADVTAEVTSRRLHVSNKQALQLTQGLNVTVLLHDQTASDAAHGIIATGSWAAGAAWLRHTALATVKGSSNDGAEAGEPGVSNSIALTRSTSTDGSVQQGIQHAQVGVCAHLQRVGAWVDDTPSAHELRTSRSQRGYRSLRLAGPNGSWLPVVRDGMQHAVAAGADALAGSILGLNIGAGVALEESFSRGVRQETIRSTVQVVNDLDFAIQVRGRS